MYFKKIEGERIYLSPMNPEDYIITTKWYNDIDNSRFLNHERKIVGLTAEKNRFESDIKEGYYFAIILKETNKMIGEILFTSYSFIDQTAEIGLCIGEKEEKGKGYGPEAIKLLIDYGFNTLNLQNIGLGVFGNNERAIKAYEKLGFKEYRRKTKARYINGKFYDIIFMEYLKK